MTGIFVILCKRFFRDALLPYPLSVFPSLCLLVPFSLSVSPSLFTSPLSPTLSPSLSVIAVRVRCAPRPKCYGRGAFMLLHLAFRVFICRGAMSPATSLLKQTDQHLIGTARGGRMHTI